MKIWTIFKFLYYCSALGKGIMGKEKALEILKRYYDESSIAYQAIVAHGDAIAKKAKSFLARNSELGLDNELIIEAAYLHDIGISGTNAPEIGCHGSAPYIAHGIIGRECLEKEGLFKHALIAERHIGVGLTKEEIQANGWPLPMRDMKPESVEEEAVCYLDLFFSKTPGRWAQEKSPSEIRRSLSRYGDRHERVFDQWRLKFKEPQ
jgi:uncharacterized protein